MNRVVVAFPGNEAFAERLAPAIDAVIVPLTARRFPDGESYVRVEGDCAGSEVILVCTLNRPDEKIMPLLFACDALRGAGAARVTLVAPYLAYMRQDVLFHPGEMIAARAFARIVSGTVDRVITVDPHLHRIHALSEIYFIPTTVVHAAPLIAAWIEKHVASPVLIGPDSESAQWVRDVAAQAHAPFVVLEKFRRGDREVAISIPQHAIPRDHTPVLVDDIISTGRTMIATLAHLRGRGSPAAVCIGVHAVFAGDAFVDLQSAGAARIVTCDTIAHQSNGISIVGSVAAAL